jgi:hypothetical protein
VLDRQRAIGQSERVVDRRRSADRGLVFDAYKRTRRADAARNYVTFSVWTALAMDVLGSVVFHNLLAGLVGGVCTAAFSWFWWRPGGPGARRVKDD